jgi:hypothetical protein
MRTELIADRENALISPVIDLIALSPVPVSIQMSPTRGSFAHRARESLIWRTRWRSELNSNPRFRCPTWSKLHRNSHFETIMGQKKPKVFWAFFGVQIPSVSRLFDLSPKEYGSLTVRGRATAPLKPWVAEDATAGEEEVE